MAFRSGLDYYGIEDLADIVCRSASILSVDIDRESAKEIASRSRGTPRLANRLLKRVRDYAQVRGGGSIDLAIAQEAMAFFEIDELGLDWMDIRILEMLCKTFRGRAVGLSTLASATGEDANTLEDVYEPYLLQCGLIVRTPQGRMATPLPLSIWAWRRLPCDASELHARAMLNKLFLVQKGPCHVDRHRDCPFR